MFKQLTSKILPALSKDQLLKVSKEFNFSTDNKIIQDSDQMSQEEIDSILGNEPQVALKKQIKTQEKMVKTALGSPKDIVEQRLEESEVGQVRDLFYNLIPKTNEIFPFCEDPEKVVIQETPNQNLFMALNLPIDCSYEQYENALSEFRTETDLYGDETPKQMIDPESLEFKEILAYDSKYIELARERHLINISIPGSIEVQDPRNFMTLRPIEEFRHTPLVPISDSAMRRHKEMLEEYHRRQFVFEVKQESVINFCLIAVSMAFCGYLISIALKKQEERTVAYTRLKYQRTMGEESTKVFKI